MVPSRAVTFLRRTVRRAPPLLLLTAFAALLAGSCGRDETLPTGRPIVLISIDTLRSDRLPAYGYDRVETLAVDSLRADGVLFERAYTPVPLTLPAHASLFTGRLPAGHGVRDNAGYRLARNTGATLAERLTGVGYATGGAVSSYVLRGETGIGRGFDRWDDRLEDRGTATLADVQRPGGETLEGTVDWLRSLGADGVESRPFFCFFHLFEPHTPRRPPEPYASRYADPYDGEVAAADAVVGDLLDELRAKGLYERSTVILVSDHGEGLGDHGEDEHGILLYRPTLQVPLIVKLPGGAGAGTTVAEPVSLIDLFPTLLALGGAEVPSDLPGRMLPGLGLGPDPSGAAREARPIYSETFHPRLRFGWSPLVSVIQGRHHYIEGVDRELYDLVADPAEEHDLVREERQTYAHLRDALGAYERNFSPPFDERSETRRALASLGYLGGTTASTEGPPADPKERIGALDPLRRGIEAVAENRAEHALPLLRRAAEEIPASVDAWQFLGVALQRTGEPEAALDAYEKAFELSNGAPELARPMAGLALSLGHADDALVYLRIAVEEDPEDLRLRLLRTQTLLLKGRTEEARRSADEALTLAPESPDALYQRGAVAMGSGDLQGAEQLFRRALDRAPEHPAALNDLAVLLLSRGRQEEARPLLERLIEVQPENRAARRALRAARGGS